MKFFKTTLLALFLTLQIFVSAQSQTVRETYKDKDGKVLTEEEVSKIMGGGSFDMSTKILSNGDKEIILSPGKPFSDAEKSAMLMADENWRKSLMGKPFPDFEKTSLNGKTINKSFLKGKVVVFNFWFVACKPCVREIPDLNKLVSKYDQRKVVFVAPGTDSRDVITNFIKKLPFDYTILPDSGSLSGKVSITGYPTHFVVDQDGIIRAVFVGGNDQISSLLSKEIDKLLK
ncbi:MAG: hypothetical protein CO119_05805 [Flavobacteriales bacterium CG_4_9_14_3_um_filter_40_17]|nr:MAG: hypothetical protein CO119_05805 [Flavobacteriales bacterium CG_4_9_14_3_um_filter_40_17]